MLIQFTTEHERALIGTKLEGNHEVDFRMIYIGPESSNDTLQRFPEGKKKTEGKLPFFFIFLILSPQAY